MGDFDALDFELPEDHDIHDWDSIPDLGISTTNAFEVVNKLRPSPRGWVRVWDNVSFPAVQIAEIYTEVKGNDHRCCVRLAYDKSRVWSTSYDTDGEAKAEMDRILNLIQNAVAVDRG